MDKRLFTLLIIIALGIWANVIATVFLQPTPILAASGTTDVNIEEVGGKSVSYGAPIDVNIDEIAGMTPCLTFPIPVEVE